MTPDLEANIAAIRKLMEQASIKAARDAMRPENIRLKGDPDRNAGWGSMEEWAVQQPENQAAALIDIIDATSDFLRVIVGCSGGHNGGAAASRVEFFTTSNDPSLGGQRIRRVNLVNGGGLLHNIGSTNATDTTDLGFFGSCYKPIPIWPNYKFRLSAPATGAGESFAFIVQTLRLPADTQLSF